MTHAITDRVAEAVISAGTGAIIDWDTSYTIPDLKGQIIAGLAIV